MSAFNQPSKRTAQFIKPNMDLKQKVGYGGISSDVLNKAQDVIDSRTDDYVSMATPHLTAFNEAIRLAGAEVKSQDSELYLMSLLDPAMQLKGHGGMFGYPSISMLAGRLVQFLEVVETLNVDVLDVCSSYYTAMNALIVSRVSSVGDEQTQSLYEALNNACNRYFEKHQPAAD